MRSMKFWLLSTAILVALGIRSAAQPVFTGAEIFPPEEFAARRARVMDKIGDAVAILQGTTERPGEQPLRQNNQFFYLTGVVEPRAIVTIDGRTKKTTLYLQPKNERRESRMLGPARLTITPRITITIISSMIVKPRACKALIGATSPGPCRRCSSCRCGAS